MKITSRDNRKIKLVRKVRDNRLKELIFLEGLRLCKEVLRSEIPIQEVFYTKEFAENERGQILLSEFDSLTGNIFEVEETIFDSISATKNTQGIILICRRPHNSLEIFENSLTTIKKKFPLLILLHEINNPSNLGAILRTAEAAGVAGIILTKNSADVFSPKALRGAMGANLRLPIWADADFFEVIKQAKEKNFSTICADVNSEKSYLEVDWKKPRLLIFGSEAHGLSFEERNSVEESLLISMENEVESLNLAVSCAVILFEAKRQQNL